MLLAPSSGAQAKEVAVKRTKVWYVKAFLTALLLCFLSITTLQAAQTDPAPAVKPHPKNFGLGLIVGLPTGLSGKLWVDRVNAWDFALGSFGYNGERNLGFGGFIAHADYLWHRYGVFGEAGSEAAEQVPLYFGVGGVVATPFIGARAVAGITYISVQPFDFFVELAPTVVFGPNGSFGGIDLGLGGRYYF